MPVSLITDVEVIPLITPDASGNDCDGSAETVVVKITDEHGRVGIGEADAPASVVKAFIEMPDLHCWSLNVVQQLIGRDPFELRGLYDALYDATVYPGRRGLGVIALSAVDIALHDLAGRQLDRPVYQLLGGARKQRLTPYATIFQGLPQGRTIAELMDDTRRRCEAALALGFSALKLEVMFEDLLDDAGLVDFVAAVRAMIGARITLLVDFGYRWRDWRSALWTLRRLDECDIYLAEATLQHDDLTGHAKLVERADIRIGGAEWATGHHECAEWLRVAGVDVLQPDINRVGGLTEIMRVDELARAGSASVIPHGFKTGITAAAARHFHAAASSSPHFEFLSPNLWPSPIRRGLVHPEPEIVDGAMALPDGPGLGVELDDDIVERYRVDRRPAHA